MLSIESLRVEFGGLVALDGLDLGVAAGHIHGVIGPNGAGKTTLLNVITRLQRADAGRVLLDGTDLTARRPWQLPALGVCRTFQHAELFVGLTVLENVMIGSLGRARSGFTAAVLRSAGARRDVERAAARATELLELVGLAGAGHREASSLPFAGQQLVGLARALASAPRLLLLDEPAASMTRAEVAVLRQLLQRVRAESGVTILLVEHVMELVMAVCDRVTVLNQGRTIAEGAPHEVRRDATVLQAYLGTRAAHA
jgi:branched-chain amino acid transport system ATP-binding protein